MPAERIAEGANILMRQIDTTYQNSDDDRDKLQNFCTYIRNYSIPLSDIMTVFNKPVRTNNTCEYFHLYATK